eukprot:Lankesteria_metandrocarpae@DN4302_c0_g1_i3.p2
MLFKTNMLTLLVLVLLSVLWAPVSSRSSRKAVDIHNLPQPFVDGPQTLTSEELETLLDKNEKSLPVAVEFFVTWCPHCKKFAPKYAEVVEEYSDKNIVFTRVECSNDHDATDKYKVNSFPTIILFMPDGTYGEVNRGKLENKLDEVLATE